MPPTAPVTPIRKRPQPIHVDVGIIYMTVPTPINPTPSHHNLSALYGSVGLRIAGLIIGLKPSSIASRLALAFAVDLAALEVGLRV